MILSTACKKADKLNVIPVSTYKSAYTPLPARRVPRVGPEVDEADGP